jgi:hypothetical protein
MKNLALRQQLAVLRRSVNRKDCRSFDVDSVLAEPARTEVGEELPAVADFGRGAGGAAGKATIGSRCPMRPTILAAWPAARSF